MNFDERLNMYLEGEFITQTDVDNINKIIKMFKDDEGIELTEENAGMFVAHLCAAYSRLNNNGDLDALPDELFAEVKREDTYDKSLEILKKINDICELSEDEQKYVLLHLNNLLKSCK